MPSALPFGSTRLPSMRTREDRVLVVPLLWPAYEIRQILPMHLGYGLVVRDTSQDINRVDLSLWSRYLPEEDQRTVKGWNVCLEMRYRSNPRFGAKDEQVRQIMGYVIAHLRVIVPNRTNLGNHLMARVQAGVMQPLSVGKEPTSVLLEDCEILCAEVTEHHVLILREWMPWILLFQRRWERFYPLYLSLHLAEMARVERDSRVRHLLRVMALEALLSSDRTFGKGALVRRVPKLVGPQIDVYSPCRNTLQTFPPLLVENVLAHVCDLRNMIAHGTRIPQKWLVENCRPRKDAGLPLCYAEELCEAATCILGMAWRKIINGRHQETFADKMQMKKYFDSAHP